VFELDCKSIDEDNKIDEMYV